MVFLETIPPELRIEIYRHIVERTIVTKAHSPHEYRGLILSCKEVYAEYRFEADKLVESIKADVDSHWGPWPELKIDPSRYTCPMQIHVSIPLEVLRLADLEREQTILAIIPLLTLHRTRVVFSLYEADCSAIMDSNNAPPDIEWDWCALAQLYNLVCRSVGGYTQPFWPRDAKDLWSDKGYQLVSPSNVPLLRCKYVALHMRNRIVVYDARMSKDELEGASSGHLWEEGKYTPYQPYQPHRLPLRR